MECVLQGERSLLMQFFIVVTPVEVCNHGPSSILHPSSLGLVIEGGSDHIALYPVPSLGHSLCMLISEIVLLPCPCQPVHLASWPHYPAIPSSAVRPSSGWTCRQLR